MNRGLMAGLAILGGVVFLGRARRSGFDESPRSFNERALDDIAYFARNAYPAQEVGPYREATKTSKGERSGIDITNPEIEERPVDCRAIEPFWAAGLENLEMAFGDTPEEQAHADQAKMVFAQAWGSVVQPGACSRLPLPSWVLKA